MANNKGKKNSSTPKRELKSLPLRSPERNPYIVLSLKDLDRNQGQTLEDWQEEEILAKAIERLQGLCSLTVSEAQGQAKISIYNKIDFPENSDFKYPRHIPEDVTWASVRLANKPRIIGYLVEHIFYVVFLDKDHKFWITEKKNT